MCEQVWSGLPPKADLNASISDVAEGPRADAQDSKDRRHAAPVHHRTISSLARLAGDGLLDLFLHGFQVEAGTPLHRRKFDRSSGHSIDLFLHELEPPELVRIPIVVVDRAALHIH